ncbi:MAG TPA: hypothetical protein VJ957_06535 [Longimicrobiales bacterium]|nr:hypothetical protein [Longimicrobiales bacterium]
MAEQNVRKDRRRAIFDLVFTSLLIGISAGAGPLGIIAMQYTSDRISYWQGAIAGSILAVLVVGLYLLYQDWQGPHKIFGAAQQASDAADAGGRNGGTPGAG